ncbi:MAG: hypothetical protein EHM70_25590 [Chloroflexota bacterium]|nr:MAG: hypothetical protein EHM70_25590 [Chloroflexota bacterium]
MERVYRAPLYFRNTGLTLLALVFVLYLVGMLALMMDPVDSRLAIRTGLIFITASLPFVVLALSFFVYGSGRYILNGDAIIWERFGKQKSIHLQEISGFKERGYSPLPALVLYAPGCSLKISRFIENYTDLYASLSEKVTSIRDAEAASFPWRLQVRASYFGWNLAGLLALILIICGLGWVAMREGGSLNLERFTILTGIVSSLIGGTGATLMFSELRSLFRLSFTPDEIIADHLVGSSRRWWVDSIEAISRQPRYDVYRGGRRLIYPLVFNFSSGDSLEITDEFAAACGLSLERLEKILHRLYHQEKPVTPERDDSRLISTPDR